MEGNCVLLGLSLLNQKNTIIDALTINILFKYILTYLCELFHGLIDAQGDGWWENVLLESGYPGLELTDCELKTIQDKIYIGVWS